jgi:sn-glycerol 3-phosphate transport system permease protein
MVENRPWLNILTHATLIFGVAFLCFPVWMALVASTHPGEALSRSPIPHVVRRPGVGELLPSS